MTFGGAYKRLSAVMKRAKAIFAAIAATAATLAGLDLTGIIPVMPASVAKWLVIIPSGAAVIVHLAEALKLQLDKIERDA